MGKRDERKGNDMLFSVGRTIVRACECWCLSRLVNASNFTRLISLSLAAPARSTSEDGCAGTKEKEKKENNEMIILQYKSATYRITRSLPPPFLRSRARPCRVGVGPRGD